MSSDELPVQHRDAVDAARMLQELLDSGAIEVIKEDGKDFVIGVTSGVTAHLLTKKRGSEK